MSYAPSHLAQERKRLKARGSHRNREAKDQRPSLQNLIIDAA